MTALSCSCCRLKRLMWSKRDWSFLCAGLRRHTIFRFSSLFLFTMSLRSTCSFSYSSSHVWKTSKHATITCAGSKQDFRNSNLRSGLVLCVILKPRGEYLLKLLVRYMHELAGAQHFEQLRAQVSGDGLHQTQRTLDGVLGVSDLAQVSEDGHQRLPDLVQLSGRQEIVEREVLHQRVVVVHRLHSLLQT